LLHLVGSSLLPYQIDDARSNKNRVSTSYTSPYVIACSRPCGLWVSRQAIDSTFGQRISPVGVLIGSPHQPSWSWSSQSGQTAEHSDPRVSVCYLRTMGHQ